jgi:hypothetical protein
MDSPATVNLLDQTQIDEGARTPRGFLNLLGFEVLAILLGIALAFM